MLASQEGPDPRAEPLSSIEGGTVTERARMRLAIRRFRDAGLDLPHLRIVIRVPSDDECHGALGYFNPSKEVWEISICSGLDSVSEHELAHAWERTNLSDAERRRYTDFRGLPTWSDKEYEWNQRAVEDAAFVIQQGLSGLPLPPVLGGEAKSRLEGYELLTGKVANRLVEWMWRSSVPCDERPTELSRRLPDISGRICGTKSKNRHRPRSTS